MSDGNNTLPVNMLPGVVKKKDWLFKPGNNLSQGHRHGGQHAKQAALLRGAFFNTLTYDDMVKIVQKVVLMAKRGNMQAIKEVMDRAYGKPSVSVEITPVEPDENVREWSSEELQRLIQEEKLND